MLRITMKMCLWMCFVYLFKVSVSKGDKLYITTVQNDLTTTLHEVTNDHTSTRVIEANIRSISMGKFIYYVKEDYPRKIFKRIGGTAQREFAKANAYIDDVYVDQSNGDVYYYAVDGIGIFSKDGKVKLPPIKTNGRDAGDILFVRHTSEDTEIYYSYLEYRIMKLSLKTRRSEFWIAQEKHDHLAVTDKGLFRWRPRQPDVITEVSFDKKIQAVPLESYLSEADRKYAGELNSFISNWLFIVSPESYVGYDLSTKGRTLLLRCTNERTRLLCADTIIYDFFLDKDESVSLASGTDRPQKDNRFISARPSVADTPEEDKTLIIITTLICIGGVCFFIFVLMYLIKTKLGGRSVNNNNQTDETHGSDLYTSTRDRTKMDTHIYTMPSTGYLELCTFNQQLDGRPYDNVRM